MKKIRLLFLASLLAVAANGQKLERQVIASGGSFAADGNLSLAFTVGELAVLPLETGQLLLLQGFQQGESAISTGWQEPALLSFSAFPNPSTGSVTLFLPENAIGKLKIGIFNAAGVLLQQQTAAEVESTLDLNLEYLPAGTYFILLENARQERGVTPLIKE